MGATEPYIRLLGENGTSDGLVASAKQHWGLWFEVTSSNLHKINGKKKRIIKTRRAEASTFFAKINTAYV